MKVLAQQMKNARVAVPVGRVTKNGSSFKHFDHEGALAQHDFVAGTNASEHSVDNRQPAIEDKCMITTQT
jgi:hypothetical protein